MHEERRAGELTSERLGQIWLEVQGESLGPAIELADGYETYWSYIPHFIHSPFYVYAYAFGDCLVNSLYGLYQDAHPGFVAEVLRDAEGRGLQAPLGVAEALRARCFAARFWHKGLKVIEGMIDELERRLGRRSVRACFIVSIAATPATRHAAYLKAVDAMNDVQAAASRECRRVGAAAIARAPLTSVIPHAHRGLSPTRTAGV